MPIAGMSYIMDFTCKPASVTALYMEPAQFLSRGPGADMQGYSLFMALSAMHQQM